MRAESASACSGDPVLGSKSSWRSPALAIAPRRGAVGAVSRWIRCGQSGTATAEWARPADRFGGWRRQPRTTTGARLGRPPRCSGSIGSTDRESGDSAGRRPRTPARRRRSPVRAAAVTGCVSLHSCSQRELKRVVRVECEATAPGQRLQGSRTRNVFEPPFQNGSDHRVFEPGFRYRRTGRRKGEIDGSHSGA